jgi:ADP-ribose pyrophosphatase
MKKVEIERSRRVFDDFFKIEEVYLSHEQFNGQMSPTRRLLNFERGDGIAAILMNRETQRVILIQQFRYPTYARGHGPGWIIETVAGMLEAGEEPEEAIRREILEETGYTVTKLSHISTFYVSPGGSSERILLYYAEVSSAGKLASGGGLASENEDIQLLEFTLPELWQALDSGQIVDAKTIIGLMWLRYNSGLGLERRNEQ